MESANQEADPDAQKRPLLNQENSSLPVINETFRDQNESRNPDHSLGLANDDNLMNNRSPVETESLPLLKAKKSSKQTPLLSKVQSTHSVHLPGVVQQISAVLKETLSETEPDKLVGKIEDLYSRVVIMNSEIVEVANGKGIRGENPPTWTKFMWATRKCSPVPENLGPIMFGVQATPEFSGPSRKPSINESAVGQSGSKKEDENLSLTDLHRLFGQRPILASADLHLLDPITRNAIRRENAMVAKSVGLKLTEDLNKTLKLNDVVVKISDKVWLYLFETGIIAENMRIALAYLNEVLTGTVALQKQLYGKLTSGDITTLFNLLSMSRGVETPAKEAEGMDIELVAKIEQRLEIQLEIIYHAVVLINDIAFEGLDEEQIKNRKVPPKYLFSDEELVSTIVKGFVGILSNDIIKSFFKDDSSKKLVNRILQVLLSLESDQTLQGMHWLEFLPPLQRVKDIESPIRKDMVKEAGRLNDLLQQLCTGRQSTLPIDYAGLPNSEAAKSSKFQDIIFVVKDILNRIKLNCPNRYNSRRSNRRQTVRYNSDIQLSLSDINYDEKCFWFSVLDFPTYLMWLCLLSFGAAPKAKAREISIECINVITDYCLYGPLVQGQFFKKKNFNIFKALNRACDYELLRPLEGVFSSTSFILNSKSPEFFKEVAEFLKLPIEKAWSCQNPLDVSFPVVRSALLSIETLRQILQTIGKQPKCRRSRMQLELSIQRFLYSKANVIMSYFSTSGVAVPNSLKQTSVGYTKSLHQILIAGNQHHPTIFEGSLDSLCSRLTQQTHSGESMAGLMGSTTNSQGMKMGTKSSTGEQKPSPPITDKFLFAELAIHTLRLLNDSIRFSGGFSFLYNDQNKPVFETGTYLDWNRKWNHAEYDYLRYVPSGNIYLAEVQCFYAHHILFNRQLEYVQEPPTKPVEENPSQVRLKHNTSVNPNNLSVLPELTKATSRNLKGDNNWAKILNKQPTPLLQYCKERTQEICSMITKTEGLLRDGNSESLHSQLGAACCLRGPLKMLHRYLCGVLVRVPPQDYHYTELDKLVIELKDNLDALIKMAHLETFPPATDSLLAEYYDTNAVEEAGGGKGYPKEKTLKANSSDRTANKFTPEQLDMFKRNQLVLLKLVTLIEEIFKHKGCSLDIMEVRRETDFELNLSETSSLYAGIGACENLALNSWMKIVQHIDSKADKSKAVKKVRNADKDKQKVDGLLGESPQETLERDQEFEQIFSLKYSDQDLGLSKGANDLYDDDQDDDLGEEIPFDQAGIGNGQRASNTAQTQGNPSQTNQNPGFLSQPTIKIPPKHLGASTYFVSRKKLMRQKRIALSEQSCFFRSVDIGSNVSHLAYWDNLIGWIHFVLTDKLSQSNCASRDLELLFFDEDFISLLNMLHNFTKQKKDVRNILFKLIDSSNAKKQPKVVKEAMKSIESEPVIPNRRTLDQYLFNTVILLQHSLKQAVLGTNLKSELEAFFTTAKLVSSLMENNCNEFKGKLIEFMLTPESPKLLLLQLDAPGQDSAPEPVNALGMMYDGLVLNSDISEPNICTEDRGDMVWYNITCLTLMAECMSGPFETAQNKLVHHISQKSSYYLRMLRICMRLNTNINSSFFDLQDAVVEFLAAIFEGVNEKTAKVLNTQSESAPGNMFKMIVSHLENLWLNANVVIQTKEARKRMGDIEPNQLNDKPADSKQRFTNLMEQMSKIEKKASPVLKQEELNLDKLLDYYTLHSSFSTHPSISIARKLYDIMTYAETIDLRKFARFLQLKRQLMQQLPAENTGIKVLKALGDLATGQFLSSDSRLSRQASVVSSGIQPPSPSITTPGPQKENGQTDIQKDKSTMFFKFLMQITGSVEVVVDSRRVCVQFPLLPECKFITEEEVEHFIKRCSIEDPSTRLFELIDFVDEVLIEKQNDLKFYKIFPPLIYLTRRRTFKLMVLVIWVLSAAINIIWIISSDIIDTTDSTEIFERMDTISIQQTSAQLTIAILSVVIVFLSLLIFVIWLSIRWLNLVNIRELQLKKQKALNTQLESNILKFKAYVFDSLLGQPLPMVLLLHILFVVLYYLVTDFFVCLHLLLFVYHSETTRYIMRSVTKDLRKIGITFLMIIFMVYCYSTVIGFHYADKFDYEFENINPCENWMSCLVYTFDYGLRLGGGVGDAMNLLPREDSYFTEKLIINLTFLLLIKLIASNIVLGIIIDTFSELRDTQSTRGSLILTIRSVTRKPMLHLWN